MIERRMRDVQVISFTNTVDTHGQPRRTVDSTRDTKMFVSMYSQTNADDPFYIDVDYVGLTKDSGINDKNQIMFDNIYCNVAKVIPTSRYIQILLKRVK